jgi:hypothetical protein
MEGYWGLIADNFPREEHMTRLMSGQFAREVRVADIAPYWVLVSSPKRWHIDKFLETNPDHGEWAIENRDREKFAPGQLAIIRVGVDQRNKSELAGRERLRPGIYALCEIDSPWFPRESGGEGTWGQGQEVPTGAPAVRIRYLRNYLRNPLTIDRLSRAEGWTKPWLVDGRQAKSFALPANDFGKVLTMLGEDPDALSTFASTTSVDDLGALEARYVNASPEVKERVSRFIERGPVGAEVKRASGFKCQVCDGLGRPSLGFVKPNGEHYVEAHHVMPVSAQHVGSLGPSNVISVCANHHRELHFGRADVKIAATEFQVSVEGGRLSIPRRAAQRHSL